MALNCCSQMTWSKSFNLSIPCFHSEGLFFFPSNLSTKLFVTEFVLLCAFALLLQQRASFCKSFQAALQYKDIWIEYKHKHEASFTIFMINSGDNSLDIAKTGFFLWMYFWQCCFRYINWMLQNTVSFVHISVSPSLKWTLHNLEGWSNVILIWWQFIMGYIRWKHHYWRCYYYCFRKLNYLQEGDTHIKWNQSTPIFSSIYIINYFRDPN